jgi:hypothetical protein
MNCGLGILCAGDFTDQAKRRGKQQFCNLFIFYTADEYSPLLFEARSLRTFPTDIGR